MAEVDDARDLLPVLVAAPDEVVGREQPVRRARDRAVAVEARAHERLVGKVRPGEHAGDPLLEGDLRHRSRGRQQAVDGPLHAVRERDRRALAVGPVRQPPAVAVEPDQPPLAVAFERVAHQVEQPVHVVGRRFEQAIGRGLGVIGCRRVARRVGFGWSRRADQATEMPGAIQADEDLPQQAVQVDRLAAQLEHVDGRLDHGARRVGGRERGVDHSLRRREQPVRGDQVGITRASGHGRQHDVGPGARAARHRARARRDELDHPALLASGLRQPGSRQAVPGADTAEHRRDQSLGIVTLEQQHDPCVPVEDRVDARAATS